MGQKGCPAHSTRHQVLVQFFFILNTSKKQINLIVKFKETLPVRLNAQEHITARPLKPSFAFTSP